MAVQIRFDLQLYQQDPQEDSYLVDFRLIGHRRVKPDPNAVVPGTPALPASEEGGTMSDPEGRDRAESTSTVADTERERIRTVIKSGGPGGASSPLLFFELACRCVTLLASSRRPRRCRRRTGSSSSWPRLAKTAAPSEDRVARAYVHPCHRGVHVPCQRRPHLY
jgi:hypothetical protein